MGREQKVCEILQGREQMALQRNATLTYGNQKKVRERERERERGLLFKMRIWVEIEGEVSVFAAGER